MPDSLREVKAAIQQGDKQRARVLLRPILQKDPTADAWYLAARVASSREQAAQYLQRALRLDSNHAPAKKMLAHLKQSAPAKAPESVKSKQKPRKAPSAPKSNTGARVLYLFGGASVLMIVVALVIFVVLMGRGAPAAPPAAGDTGAPPTANGEAQAGAPTLPPTWTPSQAPPTDAPTETPMPTDEPAHPAGWAEVKGGGAALWLPESFEGGDPTLDLDLIVERLRSLGPDLEPVAQMVEANPSMFVIWAFDSKLNSPYLTNVIVTTEALVVDMSLETYLKIATQQLPGGMDVVEQSTTTVNGYPAGRLVINNTLDGDMKQLIYTVKDDLTVWTIACTTGASEFNERLPAFETIVGTFTVAR
ncbi:MAG: hypothetical protein JXB47_03605 [Anaerolineae bacterium]|nr:hypothetical protein [Anaerolineae bacterium]